MASLEGNTDAASAMDDAQKKIGTRCLAIKGSIHSTFCLLLNIGFSALPLNHYQD